MNGVYKYYPYQLRELSRSERGGYLITFSDLPGCMSDGDTTEEAIVNGQDAFNSWMKARKEWGESIPLPSKI